MADFQSDVMDHLAQVLGGAVNVSDATFFNGTPVAGLLGCYAAAPRMVQSTPVAVLMPGRFSANLTGQGKEFNEDEVRILILAAPYSLANMPALTPFRDSIPAAFRAHMQAYSMPDAVDAWIVSGSAGVHNFGNTDYLAWEFVCRVRRMLSVTYTS